MKRFSLACILGSFVFFAACSGGDSDPVSVPAAKESSSSVTSSSSESSSSAKSSSSSKNEKSSSSSVQVFFEPSTVVMGEMTDTRHGQNKKTVTIGTHTFMAEKLNFETENSYCYNDSAEYCAKYGRLYTWAAAMDSAGIWSTNGKGCGYRHDWTDRTNCSPTYPLRGVCPEGWLLPSGTELHALFAAVGGKSTVGKVLKSTSGWYDDGNGTDAYAFSALPAGYRNYDGSYHDEGKYALFWSSGALDNTRAYGMRLYYGKELVFVYDIVNAIGLSVRCLKD